MVSGWLHVVSWGWSLFHVLAEMPKAMGCVLAGKALGLVFDSLRTLLGMVPHLLPLRLLDVTSRVGFSDRGRVMTMTTMTRSDVLGEQD